MRGTVAGQNAGVGGVVVGDGRGSVLADDVDVEIDESLAGDVGIRASDAVGGVTNRTSETGVDVAGVLRELGIGEETQVMALTAHCIGAVHAEVGIAIEVGDELSGGDGLVEFVAALEDVSPLGSVWTVRSGAAEFAIVVGVMAVGTEDLVSHGPARSKSIEIEHIRHQTGLRKGAVADVSDGMARSGGGAELQDDVERIAGGRCTHGKIAVDGPNRFAGAASVTAEAILVLIDDGIDDGNSIVGADTDGVFL